MQLVAYGAQDVYLTGNPQITFFKVVYRRHTNFSIENIEHAFNGAADFGRKVTACIIRNGDLVWKMYLRVILPKVTLPEGTPDRLKDDTKFAWTRRLGHAIIDSVEVEIGGSRIDKQYGDWLNIWYELARQGDHDRGYAHMIGDIPALTKLEGRRAGGSDLIKPEYTLFIPLQFWFNRHTGLALPLIALQYHEVRVHFEFRDLSELCVYTGYFNNRKNINMKDASLLVDYIYLDSEERRRFAQVGHEYLIEQLQFTGEESVQNNSSKFKLGFNHPNKEIVWAMKNGDFVNGRPFLAYSHCDTQSPTVDFCVTETQWDEAINDAACNLALGMFNLDACEGCPSNAGVPSNNMDAWTLVADAFDEHLYNESVCNTSVVCGITITVDNKHNQPVYIRPDVLVDGNFKLTSRLVSVNVEVEENGCITICSIRHKLTLRDVSRSVCRWTDNRNLWVKEHKDVYVNQFHNYGMLLDGSVNPVHEALIQLNGHDRFDKREGAYFNYVQPWQHHTNTPADGINVYSFALKPEEHQPSGTANLSRIDTTQLNLWFNDNTSSGNKAVDGFHHDFLNDDTELFIFSTNYNVLRIMSGMGGLAYSN